MLIEATVMKAQKKQPHVVIVGGGFGGLSAAQGLAHAPVQVTLVDRQNHHLFQPLLYQVAMAGLSPADIAMPIRAILRRRDNIQVLLGEVSQIALDERRVALSDGATLHYDYLVLAAGARTNYFGKDAWKAHALGLKTIDDALDIRRRVLLAFEAAERENDATARERLLTFVVIGGGPTGVEVAGALAELARFVLADDFRVIHPEQARIILVEMMDRLLAGGFSTNLGDAARRQLEALGVEVRLGARVVAIDERGVHLDGDLIEAKTVLWTAGVRARRIAETLGVELDKGGRVHVGADCSIPGHPEGFVIGDMARFTAEGSREPLPGIAPVAMQQGRYVARRIARSASGKDTSPFSYLDKGIMATVGRSRAIVQVRRLELAGFVAWLAWIVIHIVYLIGFRNRVSVMLNWFWSYLTYKRGARLITGDGAWHALPALTGTAERVAQRHAASSHERATEQPRA
jgi:NADH dehydrogenase